jgi:hypothetical protein
MQDFTSLNLHILHHFKLKTKICKNLQVRFLCYYLTLNYNLLISKFKRQFKLKEDIISFIKDFSLFIKDVTFKLNADNVKTIINI